MSVAFYAKPLHAVTAVIQVVSLLELCNFGRRAVPCGCGVQAGAHPAFQIRCRLGTLIEANSVAVASILLQATWKSPWPDGGSVGILNVLQGNVKERRLEAGVGRSILYGPVLNVVLWAPIYRSQGLLLPWPQTIKHSGPTHRSSRHASHGKCHRPLAQGHVRVHACLYVYMCIYLYIIHTHKYIHVSR